MFQIKKLLKSLKFALRGISILWKNEPNFRWQILAAFLVIIAMLFLGVARSDVVIILLIITFVLTLEIVNTVVERLVDMLKPRLHTYAESIKDLMAALVLIGSIAAIIIGIVVFYPYILYA